MDTFICNKCFASKHRGRTPFCLTQCGHIYCSGCIRQAEKQCPQCQETDTLSIELRQPSLSKVEKFFVPLDELLESLHKNYKFQSTQTKIMIQRFHEIDKKYETLKATYCNLAQYLKMVQDKYIKLKVEYTEQQKKLVSMEMHNKTMNSLHDIITPISPNIKRNKQRNTTGSGVLSYGTGSSYMSVSGGFRKPPYVPSTIGSRATSDTNSTYTFKP